MVATTALVPLVFLLALGADAAPSNDRRSWGNRRQGTRALSARAATTTTRAAGDLQTYNAGLGGVFAPPVTVNNGIFYSSNIPYVWPYDALIASCNTQAVNCAASSSVSIFDSGKCPTTQLWACTSGAQAAADAYTSSAAKAASSSAQAYSTSAAAFSASQASASARAYSSSSAQQFSSASQYSASASAYSYSSSSSAAASASAYSYSSSSSAAAARATPAPVSSSSSRASSSSSSSAAATSSASSGGSGSATTVAGNVQTFSGTIGGAAPAVTQNSQGQWVSNGITYPLLLTALQQSCYAQAGTCSTASSVSDKSPCWGTQIQNCLSSAQTISDSYGKNAASYSSSVASANFAKATAARTVAGDLQSFTGALGGIAAPAVTGSPFNWWMNGIYFYNLIDALQQSCWVQQDQCLAKVATSGGYELTISNCQDVQRPACMTNAQNVVANYGKSSSAAPTSTSSSSAANTASASAYSQSSSLAAYSSSVNAANANNQAQQSASAYSQSSSLAAYSSSVNAANGQAQQSASAYSQSSSLAAYSQSVQNAQAQQSASAYSQSASAYSQSVQNAQAQQSASAYSQSAAAYSQSVQNAQAQQSASAYSQSAAAYSQSVQNAQAQQSASAYSQSAAAYSQSTSLAAYSQSVQNAQAQQSASAYSQSASAYSASVSAQQAQQSASAYSQSVSAAAYSASSAAAAAAASASAALGSVPTGWSQASTACIAEGTTGRALISDSITGNDMTWAKCTSYCDSKGYPLAGIEYSSECYCGNVLSNGASLNRPSAQCNMFASGSNGQQAGGGPNAITLFVSNKLDATKYTSDLSGMVTKIPDGWTSTTGDSGICIVEGTSGRALAAASTASDDMTIGKCIAFCSGKGMQYAGLEYSRECYCGNDLVNGASKDRTAPCNMQCAGAPGTICGGPALLSVYQSANLVYTATSIGDYKKQGCIQEVAGRAFNEASIATSDMTLEKCTSFCQQGGYAFAGLEYSSECYCGNSLANGASLSAYSTECKMPCSGNSQEICGGPNAITLYATQAGLSLVGA